VVGTGFLTWGVGTCSGWQDDRPSARRYGLLITVGGDFGQTPRLLMFAPRYETGFYDILLQLMSDLTTVRVHIHI